MLLFALEVSILTPKLSVAPLHGKELSGQDMGSSTELTGDSYEKARSDRRRFAERVPAHR